VRALVTGAAGGIGSAIATAFEQAGHEVLRHDVRAADGIDLSGDLLDPVTLAAISAAVEDNGIDTVVAGHGIAGPGRVDEIEDAGIRRIVRINTSSVLGLHDTLRRGLAARDGAFVTVSSEAGIQGEAQNGIYSASKFALVGWAREIAAADQRVRMRVVCPGMTETPLLVSGLSGMAEAAGITYEALLADRLRAVPAGRLLRPAEIGRASVWLAELRTSGCVVAAVTGGEVFE
jgi:NAD(P)-dependent dehydrogenase (short-subunit alcohol dehydrogenase family)